MGSSQPPAEDSLTGFVFVGPFLLSFLASYDRIVNGQFSGLASYGDIL